MGSTESDAAIKRHCFYAGGWSSAERWKLEEMVRVTDPSCELVAKYPSE